MKKNIELNEILHNADSRTVEKIAANYRSVDEKTSRRMYERCVSRIKNYSAEDGFSETFSVRRHDSEAFAVPVKSFPKTPLPNTRGKSSCAILYGK